MGPGARQERRRHVQIATTKHHDLLARREVFTSEAVSHSKGYVLASSDQFGSMFRYFRCGHLSPTIRSPTGPRSLGGDLHRHRPWPRQTMRGDWVPIDEILLCQLQRSQPFFNNSDCA